MNDNFHDFDSSYPVPETLGQYTSKTFLWMVLGLMITFGVAVGAWMTGLVVWAIRGHLLILIATLVLAITMSRRIERMTVGTAKAMFLTYSVLLGLTMSAFLLIYDLSYMVYVFLLTAAYFGALALYGSVTRRDLTSYSRILMFALIFLVIAGVVLLFVPGLTGLNRIVCLIGIATFLGYTAYDTQKIRAYYHYYAGYPDMLEKAAIFSALQLYLDFINLFLYLLRFLGRRRD